MAEFPTQGQKPWGPALKDYIDESVDGATTGLAPVATSGAYGDLTGKPTIPGRVSVRRDTPAAEWTVVHNLNGFPRPTILLDDAPFTPVFTDVAYVDANTIVLTFPSPVSGWVHLN